MDPLKRPSKCLRLDCGKPAVLRGLCKSHHRMAQRDIRLGKTTWAKLEASNKALPAKPGVKTASSLAIWFLNESKSMPGNLAQCCAPNCAKKIHSRGLCKNHYRVALHYVKTHRTTWEKLESFDKAVPLAKLIQLETAKPLTPMEKKYFVLSPDQIATRPGDAMTLAEAYDELARFCKSYIEQGFYSSPTFGRIPVDELLNYIEIVPANADGGYFRS